MARHRRGGPPTLAEQRDDGYQDPAVELITEGEPKTVAAFEEVVDSYLRDSCTQLKPRIA